MTVEEIQKLKVEHLMDKDFVSLRPDSVVSEMLGLMTRRELSEIPVVEKGRLLGLVGYNTFVNRRQLPLSTQLDHIMARPPRLSPQDAVTRAAEHMLQTDWRELPVVDAGNRMMGIIKRSEIIKRIRERTVTGERPVSEFMSAEIEVVPADHPLSKARAKMRAFHIRTLPVVDDHGKLVGMVGIRDIAAYIHAPHRRQAGSRGGEKNPPDQKVSDVMNTPAFYVEHDARMRDVLDIMIEKNVSTVPVVKDDRPVGIVTHADVLELVASYGEREGVFIQISGLEEDDPYVYSTIYDILRKSLEKINRMFRPEVLTVHVHTYNFSGDRDREIKYSVNIRLNTRKHLFAAKGVDWDLFKAIDGAMDHIERKALRKKDMKVSNHHNHIRGG